MTDAQESWDKLNLLAATSILKYEKDHICFNDSYMKQNMV